MIVGGIILVVVLLLVISYISIYNGLIRANEEVNGKWAQVETQYQRRVDLIPNLIEAVKGAKNFEQSLLTKVAELRSQWQNAPDPNSRAQTATGLDGAISRLLLVAENYPQIKSNANFLAFQDELANTENKISVERGRYNDAVKLFNAKIKTFPRNIVARNLGYSDRIYFQAATGSDQAPKVSFEN